MADEFKYVGFWQRFWALILDNIVLMPLFAMDFLSKIYIPEKSFLVTLFVIFAIAFYFIFMNGKWGATFGKKYLKIKIIRSNGHQLSYWRAFLRYIPYIIVVIVIGFLDIVFQIIGFYQVTNIAPHYNLWRTLIYFAPTFFIIGEILTLISSSKKQSIHDKIADTIVVDA